MLEQSSCCINGLNSCFCYTGLDPLGEHCSQCGGLGKTFCEECQGGRFLTDYFNTFTLLSDDQRVEIELVNHKLFRQLERYWGEYIGQHFDEIKRVSAKLFLDPFFIEVCQESHWQRPHKGWPVISISSPKPFAIQFNHWVESFFEGLNLSQPVHYDLKIYLEVINELLYIEPSCNPITNRGLLEAGLKNVKTKLISHRFLKNGLVENLGKGPWYPLNLPESQLFL